MLETQQPAQVPLHGSPGWSLALFPLGNGVGPLGVVEVVAPTGTLDGRHEVLTELAAHSSVVIANARKRTGAERELAGKNALLELASDLLWARTATEVIRLAVRVCGRHRGTATVGLIPDRDGLGWFLAGSEGLGVRRRASLRAAVRSPVGVPRLRLPSLRVRFRELGGYRAVSSFRAGAAVFLIADEVADDDEFVNGLASLVESVLPRLGLDGVRPAVVPTTELGIAWTAHELKGPLLGASAALDRAAHADRSEGAELMRRTKQELQQLSDLIDPLLRWSTGHGIPSRRHVDLVEITREAVASATLGAHADRVAVEAPDDLFVEADPQQLRSAIANVVRNALMYSPDGTDVQLRVEVARGSARVVICDRGPGIPAAERGTAFEPFSRGRANGTEQRGAGLGLFIARRVLEAHGGSISLRPSRSGATFVLEFPVERGQLFAS